MSAFPAAWRRWVAAMRQFRPDLVHVHCFGPNGVYAFALHRRFRAPLVITSHGETVADDNAVFERSAVLRAALRRSLAEAAAVTAPSSFVIDRLQQDFKLGHGLVVPNGVDLSVPGDGARTPFDGRYVLGVGRLGRIKGFDLLMDAFADAPVAPDVRLIIVGDGPERARLDGRIAECGLIGRVLLAGRLDPRSVANAMAGALAVVVPSRVEAFGIVALEAWRSGVPLVMTDRGGGRGFIRDGADGILVDPLDAAALGTAIARVAGDAGLRSRLVAAGRERVREFTWRRVAEAYRDCYAAALGAGSPTASAAPRSPVGPE